MGIRGTRLLYTLLWILLPLIHSSPPRVVVRQTRLEACRTTSAYRKRLSHSCSVFTAWCARRYPGVNWQENADVCNQLLCEFIEGYFETNDSMWIPKHTLLGIQTYLHHLDGKLTRAWNALRAWQTVQGSNHRVPLPHLLLSGMFLVCVLKGLEAAKDSLRWFTAWVLFRLGFSGLLRPGELIALRFRDILFDSSQSQQIAIVRIGQPKNRNSMGFGQFVTIRDEATVAWLHWLCKQAPPALRLWDSTRERLTSHFRECLDLLNIPSSIFSLGGLRAGGATALIIANVEVARIKFLGRWASESSMSVYIQESMSLLVLAQLEPHARSTLEALVQQHSSILASPPRFAWQHFFSRKRQWRSHLIGASRFRASRAAPRAF